MTELDTSQAAAAQTLASRVLVLAGAGSGKTRTVIQRVRYLLTQQQQDPKRILLATFTQRAARETSNRLLRTLNDHHTELTAGTFHALALRNIREHAQILGISPDFRLLSQADQRHLVLEALRTNSGLFSKFSPKRLTPESFLRLWGWAQNHEWSVEQTLMARAPEWLNHTQPIEATIGTYTRLKASVGALDFDDLMVLWRLLLDPSQPTAALVASAYDHVFVDEYQDTTPIQAGITEALAQHGASLFVVGDDAQSIYGFRGARFDNILEFPLRAPTEVHRLVISYRNSPAITKLARHSLEHNTLQFPKPLRSAKTHGPPIQLWIARDEHHEAALTVQRIVSLHRQGIPWNEQGILLRRNRDSAEFVASLTTMEIPFVLRAPRRLTECPRIELLLAHLRVLRQPRDLLAWRHIIQAQPGCGPVHAQKVLEMLHREVEHAEFLPRIGSAASRSLPPRLQSIIHRLIAQLETLAPSMYKGFQGFLTSYLQIGKAYLSDVLLSVNDVEQLRQLGNISVHQAIDTLGLEPPPDETSPGVRIGTIHSAKGIEWQAVFVPGLCEERFPSPGAIQSTDDEAEERRLFYVAITRAAEFLTLSYPRHLTSERGLIRQYPSRFLQEISPELVFRRDFTQ
ncbi:MAG: ATP-dependent helicase [Myxococcales bacterium]|nr:ATP-dependent helicase [Myxococcales bacterium]